MKLENKNRLILPAEVSLCRIFKDEGMIQSEEENIVILVNYFAKSLLKNNYYIIGHILFFNIKKEKLFYI